MSPGINTSYNMLKLNFRNKNIRNFFYIYLEITTIKPELY